MSVKNGAITLPSVQQTSPNVLPDKVLRCKRSAEHVLHFQIIAGEGVIHCLLI